MTVHVPAVSPGVQPEVGPNPYSALGPPNERTLLPGCDSGYPDEGEIGCARSLRQVGCKLPSGYRLTEKDASRDSTMVVGGISGCINHRHLWVRGSERFCDIPACQRVGQSDIGNQEIDLLGFTKRCERAGARSRLQHRPAFLPKVGHNIFAD